MRRLTEYVILPPEITPSERRHLQLLDRLALVFFAAHVPVFTIVAAVCGTGPLLAFVLTSLVNVGPLAAHFGLENPRHVARAHAVAAMALGGLLVHFGQGPMQIEMHFYFFVLQALLVVFADPLVILVGAASVTVHHVGLFFLLPASVFNYRASFGAVVLPVVFMGLESVAACFVARTFFDKVLGLDRIVRSRTVELDAHNRHMRLVLDNVGQGFVTVERNGTMSLERSAILATWLGQAQECRTFFEYVGRVDAKVASWLELGWSALEEEILPLELGVQQLPRRMVVGERILELGYRPILELGADDEEHFARMLVVLSDVTSVVARERVEAEQRDMYEAFERILRDREGFTEFFREASETVRLLGEGELDALSEVRRALHTLKGNCSTFGLVRFAGVCHHVESRIAEIGYLSEVDRAALVDGFGAVAAKLAVIVGEQPQRRLFVGEREYAEIVGAVANKMPRIDLLVMLAEWKLEPARRRLRRIGEQAQAIARRLGKEGLVVAVEDAGVRIPPTGWGPIWAAMTHAVRNAIDHGIEPAEERLELGKPPQGSLRLETRRKNGRISILIEDDGRGIDWARVAEKAKRAGMPWRSPKDLLEALFADGFSTADAVTEISGRGIGLGALRSACEALGGTLHVRSATGRGTRIELLLPAPPVSLDPPSSGPLRRAVISA